MRRLLGISLVALLAVAGLVVAFRDTSLLTAQDNEIEGSLTFVDLNPFEGLIEGELFDVVVSATDLNPPPGDGSSVFSFFADLSYSDNVSVVSVDGTPQIDYSDNFPFLQSGTVGGGQIDELGAVSTLVDPVADNVVLTVTFRVEAGGEINIALGEPDAPISEITTYAERLPTPPEGGYLEDGDLRGATAFGSETETADPLLLLGDADMIEALPLEVAYNGTWFEFQSVGFSGGQLFYTDTVGSTVTVKTNVDSLRVTAFGVDALTNGAGSSFAVSVNGEDFGTFDIAGDTLTPILVSGLPAGEKEVTLTALEPLFAIDTVEAVNSVLTANAGAVDTTDERLGLTEENNFFPIDLDIEEAIGEDVVFGVGAQSASFSVQGPTTVGIVYPVLTQFAGLDISFNVTSDVPNFTPIAVNQTDDSASGVASVVLPEGQFSITLTGTGTYIVIDGVFIGDAPAAPTNLTTETALETVTLNWDAPADTLQNYTILVGGEQFIAPGDATSATVPLQCGQTDVAVSVVANNLAGSSAPLTGTVDAAPCPDPIGTGTVDATSDNGVIYSVQPFVFPLGSEVGGELNYVAPGETISFFTDAPQVKLLTFEDGISTVNLEVTVTNANGETTTTFPLAGSAGFEAVVDLTDGLEAGVVSRVDLTSTAFTALDAVGNVVLSAENAALEADSLGFYYDAAWFTISFAGASNDIIGATLGATVEDAAFTVTTTAANEGFTINYVTGASVGNLEVVIDGNVVATIDQSGGEGFAVGGSTFVEIAEAGTYVVELRPAAANTVVNVDNVEFGDTTGN